MCRLIGSLILWHFALIGHSALAYELCTPQNDYLESALPRFQNQNRTTHFPIACVETAHLTLASTGYYGYCPTDAGQPGRTHPRPCISENYVGSVYTALVDIAECLDFDPRWAFAVFNLESALHLNAVGASTDIGIGQLTTVAIKEVNLNALPKARRMASASSKDSCKRLLPLLYDGEPDLDRRCSFISVPSNPTHNLSFGVLLLKRNRELLDSYFTRWGMVLPPGVGERRVKTLLSMLGYNAGIGGVAATVRAYLDVMTGVPLTDAHFNFENRGPASFATFVQKNFPSRDEPARNRISKYIGYILKSMRNVESRLREGLCADPELQYLPVHADSTLPPPLPQISPSVVIKAGLLDIAATFKEVKVQSAHECNRLRSEFMYVFAPHGEDLTSLPPFLARTYERLCASRAF